MSLGREFRTLLTLQRPIVEEVMDCQSKQKATHDVHAKLREFYPSGSVLMKDLKKEDTPGGQARWLSQADRGRTWLY